MLFHVNGQPVRLFFRYKSNLRTRDGKRLRSEAWTELQKEFNGVTKEKFENITPGSIMEARTNEVLARLQPNITECYITLGEHFPKKDELETAPKVAFGRIWRNKKDQHDKEQARRLALASAIQHWPRPARALLWQFYDQHGEHITKVKEPDVTPEGGGPVIKGKEREIRRPWTDLDISTMKGSYPAPVTGNKGTPLKQQRRH